MTATARPPPIAWPGGARPSSRPPRQPPRAPLFVQRRAAQQRRGAARAGVGNIAHVAVAVSVGGAGAAFWIVVAGLLGMASKFAECTLGVKFRRENPDGTISGGPMYFLEYGLAERGWPVLGKSLAVYYGICVVFGAIGVGMFQANQAFVQFVAATGEQESFASGQGWTFGLFLAVSVAAVILGGIKVIARVTSGLVPAMAALYITTGLYVIGTNIDRLPDALTRIVTEAFTPHGAVGGGGAAAQLRDQRVQPRLQPHEQPQRVRRALPPLAGVQAAPALLTTLGSLLTTSREARGASAGAKAEALESASASTRLDMVFGLAAVEWLLPRSSWSSQRCFSCTKRLCPAILDANFSG